MGGLLLFLRTQHSEVAHVCPGLVGQVGDVLFRGHFQEDSVNFAPGHHAPQQDNVVIAYSPPHRVVVIVEQFLHPLLNADLDMPIENQVFVLYFGQHPHELLIKFLVHPGRALLHPFYY